MVIRNIRRWYDCCKFKFKFMGEVADWKAWAVIQAAELYAQLSDPVK